MTSFLSGAEEITDPFIEQVRKRLSEGKGVRRRLPGGGRLHMDRRLPFLVVYRERDAKQVGRSAQLVVGEAAYLMAPGSRSFQKPLQKLVATIAEVMNETFGAFLLLEIWTAREGEPKSAHSSADEPPTEPTFRIVTAALSPDDASIRSLHRTLADIPLRPPPLDVQVTVASSAGAPALPPLLPPDAPSRGMHTLGIEVQPVYRQAESGVSYPAVFDTLRRGLSTAIRQTAFHFSETHGASAPAHYHAYGRRTAVRAARQVDRELSTIANSFDFLLQVTPINVTRARATFERHGFDRPPRFDYRPLVVDGDLMKRRLYELPIEKLEDPTLATLFADARDELARRISMLEDRNTPRFMYGSLGVFGSVDGPLLELATLLLRQLDGTGDGISSPGDPQDPREEGGVDAEGFAARARHEIARYRERYPKMSAAVEVRDDISGLMVSHGDLLVGRRLQVPLRRVTALLHHEVGTHVLTYVNGTAQPLGLLATGLAGYEELQEGLAVLAEYLVGGLESSRLRLLAARVVAVHAVASGADFLETFRMLRSDHGFAPRSAFTIAMRVHRSGGFTKDAVYLRGLVRLLTYLGDGGTLEPLYVGKVAFEHIASVQELLWREYLSSPQLRPGCLDAPGAPERLARLRSPRSVVDLIPEYNT